MQVSNLTSIVAIAAGDTHSLALKSDGTVWAWGLNAHGELGDGTTTTRTTAVQVSGLASIATLGAGLEYSVAVSAEGVVYGWGANDSGQIGDGTLVDRWSATAISEADYFWKAATPTFSLPAGTYNASQTVTVNNLQSGVTMHYSVSGSDPTESDATVAPGGTVDVDATETLKVAAWKAGYARSNITQAAYTLMPVAPGFSPGTGTYTSAQSVTISTSTSQTSIRYTTDGSTPTTSSSLYSSPVAIGTGTTLKAAAFRTGWTTSSVSSAVYVMDFGQLATPSVSPAAGTYTDHADVTLSSISGATIRYTLDGTDPTASSTLYTGTFAVAAPSTVKARAWHPDYSPSAVASAAYGIQVATPTLLPGSGSYTAGQLITVSTATPNATITYTLNADDPTTTDPTIASGGTLLAANYTLKAKAWKTGYTPSAVATAAYTTTDGYVPRTISGGGWHTVALAPDGTVWSWGDGSFGQVGDGTWVQRVHPVSIGNLGGAQLVSAGSVHSIALLGDGTVKAWGRNELGQVGDGTTNYRNTPTLVSGITTAVAVDAGAGHNLALLADGTVRAWGGNWAGQIGDNSLTNRLSAVSISGLTSVVAVAAGAEHSLALKSDGTVWGWGRNFRGEVGDGTNTQRLSPVQVSGLSDVIAIAAGNAFSLALKSNGTVWGWGFNSSGQLGDGTQAERWTPVQMTGGATDIVAIAAGTSHGIILRSDQTVWTVGFANEGQRGGGSGELVPIQVGGLPGIRSINAGDAHSLAVGNDGTVWAWGRNDTGTIGDETTVRRYTAVQIAGANFNWRPYMPSIGLAAGQYFIEQHPVLTAPETGSTIRYTTSGVDPVSTDSSVPSGGSVDVTQSLTLRVRTFKTGAPPSEPVAATYTLKVVPPTFSPLPGSYATSQSVTISTTTSSATIRYTVDGRAPTAFSPVYSAPISVSVSSPVKAFGLRNGWISSDVVSGPYWIAPLSTLTAPTITPAAGTYSTERVVTITATEADSSVRYTIDGTDPTAQSTLYGRAFLIANTTTVKARVFKTGYNPGPIATAALTIAPPGFAGAPTINPVGGRYTTQRIVTITGPVGATLRYTTNGSDPTDTDTTVSSGSTITIDRSLALKVRAWQSGLEPSVVRREDYVITGAIGAGENYSMALKANGTVWTWGDNFFGQLGDGGTATRTSPNQILTGAIAIAAGWRHGLVLKSDGTVWGWGDNWAGEAGDGTTARRTTPAQVAGLTNVVAIAAGWGNSYAVKSDGTLWAWGANWGGQIGDGTTTTRLTPVQVPGLTGVQAVAAGEAFALAIVSHGAPTGSLWGWGYNTAGQLGDQTTTTRVSPQPVIGATSIKGVVAGRAWAMAKTSADELLLWGINDNAQQAIGYRGSPNQLVPVRTAPWIGAVAELGAGLYHVLAVAKDGRVWGWGDNCEGELATEGCTWRTSAELIPAFTPAAQQVQGGAFHTLAIAQDGQVWSWGANSVGQLGTGNFSWSSAPVQVPSFAIGDNTWLTGDPDNDGLPTWREYQLGTDPLSADTDGDGVPDGTDTASGDAATNLDPDGDGLSNAREALLGTDPYNPDTDGDGTPDGADAFPLDATRSQAPAPDPNDHTPPVITLIYPSNARPVGGGI